ncbi:MAG: hypothetical protein U9P12_09885 [Verrucomicrobiota bacterium]|nr:hypothetical protein [Verrucomicrobiota bacterium]
MREEGLEHVVDMDLSKCFDLLDHDLIFKGSPKGAQNALRVAESYLEDKLKLVVNRRKTHVSELQEGVAFLGVRDPYARFWERNKAELDHSALSYSIVASKLSYLARYDS